MDADRPDHRPACRPLHAADPAKAAVAEGKAEALKKKWSRQRPSQARRKVDPERSAGRDPAGKAPLDDSLTCLARTLYWEAKGPMPKTWPPWPAWC